MAKNIGRNTNRNDAATVSTYTANAVNAIVIAPANPERIHFSVVLDPGAASEEVYIRYYPAATDNAKKGTDVLVRLISGARNLLKDRHAMVVDNVYTGEISAITNTGAAVIHVTEY